MRIDRKKIERHNERGLAKHTQRFSYLQSELGNLDGIIAKLAAFQVGRWRSVLTWLPVPTT